MGALPVEIRFSEQAFPQLTKWAWIFGFRVSDFRVCEPDAAPVDAL